MESRSEEGCGVCVCVLIWLVALVAWLVLVLAHLLPTPYQQQARDIIFCWRYAQSEFAAAATPDD